MATEDPQALLKQLSSRERQVLALVCSGFDYKTIAEKLGIKPATVRVFMGNIYMKLNLDIHNETNTRKMLLFQVFCPALEENLPVDIPINDPEPVQESALMIIPPEVEEMVKKDEKEIIPYSYKPIKPDVIYDSPIRLNPGQGGGTLRGVVIGMMLMAIVVGVLLFILRDQIFGASTAVEEPATFTQEVIVVTTTPIPQVAQVDEPSTPSETPLPTNTDIPPTETTIPSPTPEPNTQPGTILAVGEWWKEDDVWLRINEIEFTDAGSLFITLQIWNQTSGILTFQWNTSVNFSLVDNTEHVYALNSSFSSKGDNEIVEPGELGYIGAPGSGHTSAMYSDDYIFNPAVSELIFTVTTLSRIDKAEFRIPLN